MNSACARLQGQFLAHRNNTYLLVCFLTVCIVTADWIDPDTPASARATHPYNVKPPGKPAYKPNADSYSLNYKNANKTISPAPTVSPAPTDSPTISPTAYPTYFPRTFELVFSDEFNIPGRTFEDGVDPRWTALDKNDYTNDALHYYSPNNARTDDNGYLVITSEAAETEIIGFDDVKQKKTRVTKHFRSAMLQSWNKFCFTGGIIEAEAIMPGKSNVGGLWPAFWLLGNLARHTYVASSEHVWPWSSSVCTKKSGFAQRVSGCDEVVHYGLQPRVGRGAPEIDIFEVQPGSIKANTGVFLKTTVGQPFMSSSFQVAPGRPFNRPGSGEWPGPKQWYDGLAGGVNATINIMFYGDYNHFPNDVNPSKEDYWSDAISYNRQLNEEHFKKPHVYRLEWDVPTNESDGYLHWFLDGELVLAINGTGVKAAELGSEISTEPSYILLNTAISRQWGFPMQCPSNCLCKEFDCNSKDWQSRCGFSEGFCDMIKAPDKPQYKINWVRVYQDPNNPSQKVGCSTPERPTRRYIEAHENMYKTSTDARPLKGVAVGTGRCDPYSSGVTPDTCGGAKRGRCTQGRVCECLPGWTGPNCLSQDGVDPILYDVPDKISDVGFVPPRVLPRFLLGSIGALLLLMIVSYRLRRQIDGWTLIGDIE